MRIARLAEVVGLLKAHWSGEEVDVDGTYVHAHGFAGRPLPVQKPHPPIFIGGGSPKILRLAGELADIVSLNFNNAAGKLGSGSVASATLSATLEKLEWVRAGAGSRYDDIELEVAAYFVAVQDDPSAAVEAMATRFGVSTEELLEHPHALLGSVEEICERLQRRRAELGISYINVAQRNMDAFAPVVARLAGT